MGTNLKEEIDRSTDVLLTRLDDMEEDVHHLIRFHFAKRDETLNAALDRLSELDSKAKRYQP